MFKYYILIFLFFNFFFSAHAKYEKSDPISIKALKLYYTCKYHNIKRKNRLAVIYDTTSYIPLLAENKKKDILKCNQILEDLINKVDENLDFKKLISEAISNNASKSKNLYLDVYLKHNLNILWNSNDFDTVKKYLNNIENNYLKKSDLNINQTAIEVAGSLGWFFYIKRTIC